MIALAAEITHDSKMKMLAAFPNHALMLSILDAMRCQKAITVPEEGEWLGLEFGAATLNSRQHLLWCSAARVLSRLYRSGDGQ
jgi:hypothetical protein